MPRSEHPQDRDNYSTETQYGSRSSANVERVRDSDSEASDAFERNLKRAGESCRVEGYSMEEDGPISDRLVHITGNWQKKRF